MSLPERIFTGIPVSPGISVGKAHVVNRTAVLPMESWDIRAEEVEAEVERFMRAIQLSREQLARIHRHVAEALDEKHAQIYMAQSMFLEDAELIDETVKAIRAEKKNAEYLFNRRITEFINILAKAGDELFRARDSDIVDIANRVTNNLSPSTDMQQPAVLSPETVLIAHDLTPSETTPLIKDKIVAFVLEKGGPTSHTAIMAKALEIPAVVGVAHITTYVENGAQLIVDGLDGRVVVNPSKKTLTYYQQEKKSFAAFETGLETLRDKSGETVDGYSVSLRANIELPEEVEHANLHGAMGVGLFRTEFIYMNRESPPGEEEQFEIYREVVEKVKPHCVVFRTLDIGGDKFFSDVQIAAELNPFMGQRAIRLCLQHPEIFRQQLRAMLRASAYGRVRILIPMISGIEEFMAVKKHVHQIKAQFRREKVPFDPQTELGAMIEVPSAAVVADTLARECDFFSIGTNDLIQYSLAVDRGNEKVAYLYEPLHPAIMRLLQNIIAVGHQRGIPVSVCGEIAADPMMATILVGMGVDELSMSAVSVPAVKKLIRSIRLSEAKLLAEEVLGQNTIKGAKQAVSRRLRNYIRSNKVRKTGSHDLIGKDKKS